MKQLDLFIHFSKPAQIVLFPFSRRAALARAIATELNTVGFEQGKKVWKTRCREIRKGLRIAGWNSRAIDSAINGLAEAVHEELKAPVRLRHGGGAVIIPIASSRRAPRRAAEDAVIFPQPRGDNIERGREGGSA